MFEGFDISEKTAMLVTGLLGIVFGIQKTLTIWKKGEVDQSKAAAEKSVIDSLHEEFKRINHELEEARERQKEMNDLIHQQAVKLTRMEMLMMRMYNLLNHNNVQIPDDLKDHMDNLLTKNISSDTKSQ
jgi:hypothetical protein